MKDIIYEREFDLSKFDDFLNTNPSTRGMLCICDHTIFTSTRQSNDVFILYEPGKDPDDRIILQSPEEVKSHLIEYMNTKADQDTRDEWTKIPSANIPGDEVRLRCGYYLRCFCDDWFILKYNTYGVIQSHKPAEYDYVLFSADSFIDAFKHGLRLAEVSTIYEEKKFALRNKNDY